MESASKTTGQDTISVLLLGDGPLVEALEAALGAAGHDVEIGEPEHAAAMFTAVAPDLVVLCGRASEHGGAPVLAALGEGAKGSELKVAVLGAASSSPRATALAPNLPPAELARRLVEVARAPVPRRGREATLVGIPTAEAALRPAAPTPQTVPLQVPVTPPVAVIRKAPEPPRAGPAPKDALAQTLVGIPGPAVLPALPAPPAPKLAPPAPKPAPPPPESHFTTPTEPVIDVAAEVLAVEEPAAAKRPRDVRRISRAAAAVLLAVGALVVLLLPVLGSHAKGARKLSAIEITGAIAPKPVAAPAPTLRPPPTPAPEPAPSVAAADERVAPTEQPAKAVTQPRTPPPTESIDGARALSREASLAQAKASVRKADGYMRDGRLDMAEAAYLKALSLLPRYPLAIAGLARIHLERHDAGEALRWAKILIAVQPNRGNNQRMLGDAFALAGRQSDAVHAWEQAVRYGDRSARQRLGK